MKIRSLLLCCLLLIMAFSADARRRHKKHHQATGVTNRTTVADPNELNYDVKYLKFNLNVSDTTVCISGNVSTTAQVIVPSMSTYVFELDTLMVIDSAQLNGVTLPVSATSMIRTINLPTPLTSGAMFTAQVFYHGVPPPGGGFFNGLSHAVSSGGTQMVYTISDPYVASDWWPSKQCIEDKIDSVDMYVTVPAGRSDGSNGVLVSVDSATVPGYSTFHWHTNYAIDYYLISIAVAKYTIYDSYLHFTGSTDSMLIQNFFMDTATFNPLYKANFDSIGMIIDYYSSLFGRYPFWQEKYGVCYTNLPGGMEHQTMTTIGVPNTYIIAHELCHQWFGDHVTYATWGDVWLSEGFATFSEQLFLTHFWGAAAGLNHRQGLLATALTDACGELYVTDTSSATTLFYQPTVYDKGQGVVTMLRYLAPTDSMFFQVLKNYQNTYGFGLANTADLKAMAEGVYGFNLDTFFNEWVYGKGYPEYKVSWNQVGSNVYVKLIQTTSCAATTPLFSTLLELKLHSAGGDSIIKVYNNADTTIYTFNWADTTLNVYLNPDVWTVCRQIGTVTHDATLGLGSILPKDIKILPNPSKNYWEITALPDNTRLTLCDMNGRVLWQGKSTAGVTTVIPAEQLPTGDYILQLSNSNDTQSVKLVHW